MSSEKKITFELFTERVAERANVTHDEADAYLHELSRTVGDALEAGDEAKLYRFGRFHTAHFDKKPGHNPETGEALTIPDQTRVEFTPYKALLIAVNWPFRNLRTRMLPEEKESGRRSNAVIWLLLALALLSFIIVGINLSSRMSSEDTVATAPAEEPAETEPKPPANEAAPANTESATDRPTVSDKPVVTETASSTETETATSAPGESTGATTTTIAVEAGDTLWDIAISQWEDSSWWPVIYAENRASLTERNPDLIETGSSLRIPILEGGVDQPTESDLEQKEEAYRIVTDDYERLGNNRADEYRRFVNRRFGALQQ